MNNDYESQHHMKYVVRDLNESVKLETNNKCADQTAHPRSLISAFVIRFLESITASFEPSLLAYASQTVSTEYHERVHLFTTVVPL